MYHPDISGGIQYEEAAIPTAETAAIESAGHEEERQWLPHEMVIAIGRDIEALRSDKINTQEAA